MIRATSVRPWLPAPPTGTTGGADDGADRPADDDASRRADRRNLALIALGFLGVLLLIPPAHEYPIIDDWIYAGAVQHQLATGAFAMPAQSQANLAGLVLWGALWARLGGLSYTTLTAATLALALAGLGAFYGLARRVGVPPGGALLGTALLGLNPLFLHLSYSFMTDVPFLALVLIACYCYVRGVQSAGPAWLVAGGLAAAWGFTVRQFAVVVPLAFLAYLLAAGLPARRWRLPQIAIIALAPALTAAAWWLWTHDWPPTALTQTADVLRARFIFKDAWPRVFLLRAGAALPLTALSAWPALTLRPRRWWLLVLWAGVLAGAWAAVNGLPEVWIGTTAPPFTFRLGPLALPLPQQIDPFIGLGNILRTGGFDFFEYRQAPLWTPEVWALLFVATSSAGVLLLAKLSDEILDFGFSIFDFRLGRLDFGSRARGPLGSNRRQVGLHADPNPKSKACPEHSERIQNPKSKIALAAVYLTGLGICGASLALGGDYYDRYLLGFVPFVILFAVRGARGWGRAAWAYALGALAVLGGFSLLLQRDFIAHDNARWQAAGWLIARVQPVRGGYDWDNVRGAGNGRYEIADALIPGFRREYAVPYDSWLTLGWREVLAQARADLPPLPAPAPGRP